MNPLIYIFIGILVWCAICGLFIMAFGYGLSGQSPLLLRPFQKFILANNLKKLWMVILLIIIMCGGYYVIQILRHVHIYVH